MGRKEGGRAWVENRSREEGAPRFRVLPRWRAGAHHGRPLPGQMAAPTTSTSADARRKIENLRAKRSKMAARWKLPLHSKYQRGNNYGGCSCLNGRQRREEGVGSSGSSVLARPGRKAGGIRGRREMGMETTMCYRGRPSLGKTHRRDSNLRSAKSSTTPLHHGASGSHVRGRTSGVADFRSQNGGRFGGGLFSDGPGCVVDSGLRGGRGERGESDDTSARMLPLFQFCAESSATVNEVDEVRGVGGIGRQPSGHSRLSQFPYRSAVSEQAAAEPKGPPFPRPGARQSSIVSTALIPAGHDAGMADHVGIGKVEDHEVVIGGADRRPLRVTSAALISGL